jgi:hypothetical protein
VDWSYALEGVCSECIQAVAPEVHERMDNPPRLHAEARARWLKSVPQEGHP